MANTCSAWQMVVHDLKIIETTLDGVLIIEPTVFGDYRGFFKETFNTQLYQESGLALNFVQDNHSRSVRGVLRGLHLQKTRQQGKLVRCSSGAVFDVVVDVKPGSSTFGQHVGVELNDINHRQLWVPPGYAHGFCVLSSVADFEYKCTDFYFPDDEGGVIWNDPDIGVKWPIDSPSLSKKDMNLPTLRDIENGNAP
jgi:dTDP-4-dehydrorhamnose 3,5-epimerase